MVLRLRGLAWTCSLIYISPCLQLSNQSRWPCEPVGMIWLLIFLMQLHTLPLPVHPALSRILPEAFMTLGAFQAFSLQAQAVLHSLDSTERSKYTC